VYISANKISRDQEYMLQYTQK